MHRGQCWVGLTFLGVVVAAVPIQAQTEDLLDQIRSIFPTTVAAMMRECTEPATLETQTYESANGSKRVGLICWQPPNEQGARTGQWLGTLPLQEEASQTFSLSPFPVFTDGFVKPLACAIGDEVCSNWLPKLRTQYPTALQQAEFECAVKSGILLPTFEEDEVEIRCGFFATTFWDNDGDGEVDHEDPVSVDQVMTTLPLADVQ